MPFEREGDLRDAEPAHRPARDVVGVDGQRLDVDVGYAVRAARVTGRALEHLRTDAGVRPGIADDPGTDRDADGRPRRSRPCRSCVSGWRFGWKRRLSRLDRATRTGVPVTCASSAACPWTPRSSLPPNAPPVATWVTRTRALGQDQDRGDLATVLPRALALRVDAHGRPAIGRSGTASAASGSRKACSMRWVVNVPVTTCAASASAPSTSPRRDDRP